MGIFLGFVWLTTRTPHGAYARRARRNQIDRHGGVIERLGTRTVLEVLLEGAALLEHDGDDEGGDARGRVDHDAARVVEDAVGPGDAKLVVLGRQPAAAPDPVRRRVVDEHGPDDHEEAGRREVELFRPRARDEHRDHERKRHLEAGEEHVRDRVAAAALPRADAVEEGVIAAAYQSRKHVANVSQHVPACQHTAGVRG